MKLSRREFSMSAVQSVVAYGLIETLWQRDLFADEIKPTIANWMKELVVLSNDLRGQKMKDLEFQKQMEDLYRRVDLAALVRLIKLDDLEKKPLPENGAASMGFDLSKVEGLPEIRFGKQIFGCKEGRSVVPHGHLNMCTGFIILKGKWHGRHFEKLETLKDHYIIKPSIDREFGPGDLSTISDHKDNIHWFKAESKTAYIFNVHVSGYDPNIKGNAGRLYLDPEGEKTASGLIKAAKMSSAECHKKYG